MTRVKMHPKLQALQRWERIARGDIDAELTAWLQTVAAALIEATADKNDNRRRQATINAVGLGGRASLGSYALQVVVHEAAPLVPPRERAKMTRVMAGVVAGHVPGTRAEISPEATRKRIQRAKKKAP